MHKRRRARWVVAAGVVTVAMAVAAACGSSSNSGSGTSATTAAQGEVDPNGVLRVGLNFFPNQQASLDPRTMSSSKNSYFLYMMFAPLLKHDPQSGKYTPYLAKSFDIVDPKTINVTIRDDATFHDGSPVTAADAEASIMATKANTEAGTCNCNAGIALVDSVEVTGDKTFTIHMSGPGVATAYELATGPEFMISPANAGAKQSTAPVGNGPFKFDELVQGQSLSMTKYDDFWDADKVQLAGIKFVNLVEGNAQTNALLAGDVDFVESIDSASYNTVNNKSGFTANALIDPSNLLYFVDCKKPGHIWSDIDVRKSLEYAIDRDAINQAIWNGLGKPSNQFWPPGDPHYDESLADMYPMDVDKAAQLVQQAGDKGKTAGVWSTSAIPNSDDVILLLNDQWSKAGLNLKVVQTDDLVGDFLGPNSKGQDNFKNGTDANLLSHTRPGLQKLTRNYLADGFTNICQYDNPKIDELTKELYGLAPDDPKAIADWKEISKIQLEEVPFTVLGFPPFFEGWTDNIGGVDPSTFQATVGGGIPFDTWYIKK